MKSLTVPARIDQLDTVQEFIQQELEAPTDCFLIRRELLGERETVSVPELCRQLKEKGYHIYYEPWAVMYESR